MVSWDYTLHKLTLPVNKTTQSVSDLICAKIKFSFVWLPRQKANKLKSIMFEEFGLAQFRTEQFED